MEHVRVLLTKPSCLQQAISELEIKFNRKTSADKELLKRCDDIKRVDSSLRSLDAFGIQVGSLKTLVERVVLGYTFRT